MLTALFMLIAGLLVSALALLFYRVIEVRDRDTAWGFLTSRTPWHDLPFDIALVADLPEPARRFFTFAIGPGAPMRTVAELRITGKLSVGSKRFGPFAMRAYQVLSAPHGSVTRFYSIGRRLPLSGAAVLNGEHARMTFWFLRLIPLSRLNQSLSAEALFARMIVEALLWTPAALLPREGISWQLTGQHEAKLIVASGRFAQEFEIAVDADGRLQSIRATGTEGSEMGNSWGGPLYASPSDFRRFGGYCLPASVEFGRSDGHGTPPLLFRLFVEDIRLRGPWIGSSQS